MGDKFLRLRVCGALAVAGALTCLGISGSALAALSHGATPADAGRPHYVQLADLFGPSDEEKAAAAAATQREEAQDASIASLTRRVGDLESALRQLTGQLEEANHRAQMLQQRITRMKKDFDYKLCTLVAQQLGATGNGGQGQDNTGNVLPCASQASSGTAAAPGFASQGSAAPAVQQGAQRYSSLSPAQGGAAAPGRQAGVLGTLPAGTPLPQPRGSVTGSSSAGGVASSAAAAPQQQASLGGGARSQFDSAMNLLASAQYDEARGAFRNFADTHPKDDLAPQAVYWVGAIAYVQKDYPGAARAFAEEIKEYPHSTRAPESMLKLGQSLIAMNQKKEGCTTLEALSSKYPKAPRSIRRQARDARHNARCH